MPFSTPRFSSQTPVKRLLLRYAFVLAIALWSLPLAAQTQTGRLTMTVVSHDGMPVVGARIRSGSVSAATTTDGRASLNLPSGRTGVTIERIGFSPRSIVVEIQSGSELARTVVLESLALETEGIVVMSTRSERRIEDEPLRVEVIDREEIEEKLLMTPGDIAMLLTKLRV